MNILDNLNISGCLVASTANVSQLTTTSNATAHFSSSHKVQFGVHTFDANELGQLLTYLLSQHPELSV